VTRQWFSAAAELIGDQYRPTRSSGRDELDGLLIDYDESDEEELPDPTAQEGQR
jgi:hypothetical protein